MRIAPAEHERANDPELTMNEAWRLAGLHIECEEHDARVLRFFKLDPAMYSQTRGEDTACALLEDPANAQKYSQHPELDDALSEAVSNALDKAQDWAIAHDVFEFILEDLDVYDYFEFDAELVASQARENGGTLRQVRSAVRIHVVERLREMQRLNRIGRR